MFKFKVILLALNWAYNICLKFAKIFAELARPFFMSGDCIRPNVTVVTWGTDHTPRGGLPR